MIQAASQTDHIHFKPHSIRFKDRYSFCRKSKPDLGSQNKNSLRVPRLTAPEPNKWEPFPLPYSLQYLWCLRVKLTNDPLLGILYTMPFPSHPFTSPRLYNGTYILITRTIFQWGPEPNDIIVRWGWRGWFDDNASKTSPAWQNITAVDISWQNITLFFGHPQKWRVKPETIRSLASNECRLFPLWHKIEHGSKWEIHKRAFIASSKKNTVVRYHKVNYADWIKYCLVLKKKTLLKR